jgi:methyl-accepting chemotaxis protein
VNKKTKALSVNEKSRVPFETSLGSLVTNVFYANSNFELVYVNSNGLKTLEEINDVIEEKYDFAWDTLLGRSIDDFHANPQYQRKILSNPKNFPLNAEIKLGEMTLDLNVNIVETTDGSI